MPEYRGGKIFKTDLIESGKDKVVVIVVVTDLEVLRFTTGNGDAFNMSVETRQKHKFSTADKWQQALDAKEKTK